MNSAFLRGYILGITKAASYDIYNAMWIKQAQEPTSYLFENPKQTKNTLEQGLWGPQRDWFYNLKPQQRQEEIGRMTEFMGPERTGEWLRTMLGPREEIQPFQAQQPQVQQSQVQQPQAQQPQVQQWGIQQVQEPQAQAVPSPQTIPPAQIRQPQTQFSPQRWQLQAPQPQNFMAQGPQNMQTNPLWNALRYIFNYMRPFVSQVPGWLQNTQQRMGQTAQLSNQPVGQTARLPKPTVGQPIKKQQSKITYNPQRTYVMR